MEKSIAYFLYQKEGDLMYNFNYYTPTKVVFGKNTEDKCGELVKEQGCSITEAEASNVPDYWIK